MNPTWRPVKRGYYQPWGGPRRYWYEVLAVALCEWAAATASLFLLPFGYVVQWGFCAVAWSYRRASLRERLEERKADNAD